MLLIVYNSEFSEIKIYIGKLLTYWKILIPIVYSIYQKINLVYTLSNNF